MYLWCIDTPLFSPQHVLEMYLICLFQCIGHVLATQYIPVPLCQCIGHVLAMQYIPIHHRGTGMYCKMYCDVLIHVLGCIWWGIWVHEPDVNTSQYIWQYITIHRRIHQNTSKIHLNTSVMYWDVNTSQKYLIHPEYIPIHPNTSSTSSAIC